MAQTIWDEPTREQLVLQSLDSFPVAETGSGVRYRAVWRAEDDEVGLTLAAGLLTVDYT